MLVKLPKEVGKIMGTLQQAGFEAYVVGECISDFMTGKKPFGWDVSTNARLEDMKRLFPEAETLSEKFEVVRFEYIEEIVDKDGDVEGESGIIVDLAAYRAGGKYEQGRLTEANFVTTVADDLARRDFTINAIAESQDTLVDPYDGKSDVKNKLIRTVGDAPVRFREDPVRMLKAVRLAAELDFDLHKSVYDAIVSGHTMLAQANPTSCLLYTSPSPRD